MKSTRITWVVFAGAVAAGTTLYLLVKTSGLDSVEVDSLVSSVATSGSKMPQADNSSEMPQAEEILAESAVGVRQVKYPAIMDQADEVSRQMLGPWIDEFLQRRRAGGPVIEYEIVSFDNDYIQKVRDGAEQTFKFNFSDRYAFNVTIDNIVEGNTFWIASGFMPDRSDGSATHLLFMDDGTIEGSFNIMGVGNFHVQPTSDLSHHIVFLLTGTYYID